MKMTGLAEMKKTFEFPNPFSFQAPLSKLVRRKFARIGSGNPVFIAY